MGRFKDGAAISPLTPPPPPWPTPRGHVTGAKGRLRDWRQQVKKGHGCYFFFSFFFSCSVRCPRDKEMLVKRNDETRNIYILQYITFYSDGRAR